MSIFETSDSAWSALTKQFEQMSGSPGAPLIVQSPTIFRPLTITGVNPAISLLRKLLLGDNQPAYHNLNQTAYSQSNKSVQKGYIQYLQTLLVEMTKRVSSPIDYDEIAKLQKIYIKSQSALNIFTRDANKDWVLQKKNNPGLSRKTWDDNYCPEGFTPKQTLLKKDTLAKYGALQSKQSAYPALTRATMALFNCEMNAKEIINLPLSEDDLAEPDLWVPFLRTNLEPGMKWDDFFNKDAPQNIEIMSNSFHSEHYDSSWSAGGSFSYGFFSCGGSASGGHVEDRLKKGTQKLKFSFKRMITVQIQRGGWYDEGLLSYTGYVDKEEFWGPRGMLNLIPVSAVIGRGLTIEIETTSEAYDSFRDWRRTSGSAGFSFGPWSVGAGANSSTNSSSISDESTGTTLRFTDNSDQIYILSVISMKMDEYFKSKVYEEKALQDIKKLELLSGEVSERMKSLQEYWVK
ncbi:hypothetical protein [Citrobacter koseri]|uniref:Uncharacterized protein n=1 Tax=Citrobacter koseri TaxID=545 RepID=A0A2X2XHB7_CITKO|nr:hypothetical protein [Citrobacter koseri]QYG86366.1 hypothetical protein NCK_19860 [Citrobacter koseri]SQB25730.1 Uncharacterised protein [Citrobacter koseri]HCR3978043.1 hypothetical protein [Citrobacter koseri]